MDDKKEKIVNAEEQSRAINPVDSDFEEQSPIEPLSNSQVVSDNEPQGEKPDKGSEETTRRRTTDDGTNGNERRIPPL